MVTHSFCKMQLGLQKGAMNLILHMENVYMPEEYEIDLSLLWDF